MMHLGTSVNNPSFWHFWDKNSSGIHRRLLVMKHEKPLKEKRRYWLASKGSFGERETGQS
jgi:hypothetical protein